MHTVAYRLHKVCAQLHSVPVVGTQALVTGQQVWTAPRLPSRLK